MDIFTANIDWMLVIVCVCAIILAGFICYYVDDVRKTSKEKKHEEVSDNEKYFEEKEKIDEDDIEQIEQLLPNVEDMTVDLPKQKEDISKQEPKTEEVLEEQLSIAKDVTIYSSAEELAYDEDLTLEDNEKLSVEDIFKI